MLLSIIMTTVALAGSICKDGTYTESEGQGTCSWHGGVAEICGGVAEIGNSGVFTVRAPCPTQRSAARIISDSQEDMWNLAMSQARIQAQSDCDVYGMCDYDLIARARRIYACSFRSTAPSTQEINCSISYREEAQAIQRVALFLKFLSQKAGEKHLKEIMNQISKEGYTLCFHERTESIITYRDRSAFFVFSKDRRWVIDRLEPHKLLSVEQWVEQSNCLRN
jgi:hypothetical protein